MAGVFQHFFAEGAGEAELVDDAEGIDAGLAALAEDFRNDPFAIALLAGEADHFDDHFVVGPGALGAGVADVDGGREDLAIDLHVAHVRFFEVRADELVGGPLDDVDHAPAEFAKPPRLVVEPHPHAVSAGGIARRGGGDEDVVVLAGGGGGAFGPDEAVARTHAPQRANDVPVIAPPGSFVGGAGARGGQHLAAGDDLRFPHSPLPHCHHQMPGAELEFALLDEFLNNFADGQQVVPFEAEPFADDPRLGGLVTGLAGVGENGATDLFGHLFGWLSERNTAAHLSGNRAAG